MTDLHIAMSLLTHPTLPTLAPCRRLPNVVCGGVGVDLATLEAGKSQLAPY